MTTHVTKLKWGILAPGRVADSFAQDFTLTEMSEIVSVASTNHERASAFAKKFGITEVFSSYNEFYQNSSCDIVYIASPHVFHKDQVISCLKAGKAVLCEKPLGVSLSEVYEMAAIAQNQNLFFMEGMWTRFFPVIETVLKVVKSGVIGKIRLVKADFCFKADVDPSDRLLNPLLGGGSLLDTGTYVISFAQLVYGVMPVQLKCQNIHTNTGVEGTGMYLLKYPDDALAMLSTSILTQTPHDAFIYGERGYIQIKDFWHPSSATVFFSDGVVENIHEDIEGKGFIYEIREVEKQLTAGKTESPKRTLNDTAQVLTIMDEIGRVVNY